MNSGYDIVFVSDKAHIYITADRERLEQVIINLLGNAVRYSPMLKQIEVIVTVANKQVISCISDSGVGISAEDQKKIFHRFFRVGGIAATYSRSGIGLYISEQIIKRHEGNIWVESD
ncbi:MAG: ATP-binding protein [Bacteroidota bacterium]|nr:ATP-binding protein [Bacteroidota bacterium]